ncbi:hypothetical protein TNCV_3488891 [Trichonephila clavipes]|nr:hypothetical protein TNCV_3488891 [Trichonephila clavipes]
MDLTSLLCCVKRVWRLLIALAADRWYHVCLRCFKVQPGSPMKSLWAATYVVEGHMWLAGRMLDTPGLSHLDLFNAMLLHRLTPKFFNHFSTLSIHLVLGLPLFSFPLELGKSFYQQEFLRGIGIHVPATLFGNP